MAFARAARRDERRRKAELIEAVALAYGGCKSKEGAQSTARLIDSLRSGD